MTKSTINLKQYVCPHCRGPVTDEVGQVSPGYVCACTSCDEDFLAFELVKAQVQL
ncbi:hypothetical protein [Leucobacter sp. cx-169]|uniref:hypothetical protein n=1 Tax=Leucobacter sp. cx-169 TaxID=2770549 RepID=UPI00165E4B0C|nr:hypothetical protein [Leucobacter sp. cx-169]MBC9927387.1 hypothetical protein [Leucobacter sp. cx-169]